MEDLLGLGDFPSSCRGWLAGWLAGLMDGWMDGWECKVNDEGISKLHLPPFPNLTEPFTPSLERKILSFEGIEKKSDRKRMQGGKGC